MKSASLSLESIKFNLIWNQEFPKTQDDKSVSLEELIEFLIESLEDADKVNATKAENLLTRIGKPAIPYLVQGLKSANNQVKSVCAMVLVRIGQPVLDELNEFYVRNAGRSKVRWVVEFIFNELGAAAPAIETVVEDVNILPFSKAS